MPKLIQGDCLEEMKSIPDKSIDMILTDPPYGTTACKWDSIIPFEPMWQQLNRIIKKNGAICLFGSEPFSSALRMSNIKNYKYDWIWDKKIPSGMSYAKYRPMQQTENISVFTNNGSKTIYNPQMIRRKKPISGYNTKNNIIDFLGKDKKARKQTEKNPITLLLFRKLYGPDQPVHPTQKPVLLIEYLIKTYTNEGETVLDFTMGSGTTGVACINLNRKFIGIELDEKYFQIARKRIGTAIKQRRNSETTD